MNARRCRRTMGAFVLAVLVTTFAAGASKADAIGDAMGVVGQGQYGISVAAVRLPRGVSASEHVTTGYGMKIPPSVSPWTTFRGDRGIGPGSGAKIAFPRIRVGARGIPVAGNDDRSGAVHDGSGNQVPLARVPGCLRRLPTSTFSGLPSRASWRQAPQTISIASPNSWPR